MVMSQRAHSFTFILIYSILDKQTQNPKGQPAYEPTLIV